jgi:hypothetical protein
MQLASDVPASLYVQTWVGLGVVFAYYTALTIVFRAGSRPSIGVVRYEPPEGISPAVAACLREKGACERAFAASIVSLDSKGYLEVKQDGVVFRLRKLKEPDDELPPEESLILESLFAGRGNSYTFDGVEYSRLCETYVDFKDMVEGIVDPELVTGHLPFWWVGVALSWTAVASLVITIGSVAKGWSWGSIAYFGIWIVVGCSCLVAALRVWPATIHKLTSYIPFDSRPSRPLEPSDAIPIILSGSALAGFFFLAVLSSGKFSLIVAVVVVLNAVFRHALEAPTRAGRKVLVDLENFREFLSRADADRLNRENEAGHTPAIVERYSAFAVALRVEQAWGEELVENMLEFLQYDQAYRRPQSRPKPPFDNGPIELKLAPPKKPRVAKDSAGSGGRKYV